MQRCDVLVSNLQTGHTMDMAGCACSRQTGCHGITAKCMGMLLLLMTHYNQHTSPGGCC
jgi:hypothetical protein